MRKSSDMRFIYFGGEPIGVPVLKKLLDKNLKPEVVVCNPDKPSGRGKTITPPPLKTLALENGIKVWQPEKIDDKFKDLLKASSWDLFVVVAYNHILPEWLIGLPKHKTINLHPSLLPKLRGPSPIRTAILEDSPEEVGVSVILLDNKMDHGPLLATEKFIVNPNEWPIKGSELDNLLANSGGELLAKTIPQWISGKLKPSEQNHEDATYTHKITKDLGEIKIDPYNLPCAQEARQVLLKIKALDGWPGTYFFHNNKRIKITNAELAGDEKLVINRIIPEGKSEIDFPLWLKNQNPTETK